MTKLPKKQLKELFESIVAQGGAKCSKANPFILEKGKLKCYVFIKNISPAYYPKYPDNSRVQLPTSNRFKAVRESDLDFLILGYDHENEVFAAWNPSLIKDRLNEKQNVSVYSRFSWQGTVPDGEFIENHLGNDEKMFLFKKELLNEYFDRYNELFQLSENFSSFNNKDEGKIGSDVKEVREIIGPLLKEHKVLQAVTILIERYKEDPRYNNLKFKDWFSIVKDCYETHN